LSVVVVYNHDLIKIIVVVVVVVVVVFVVVVVAQSEFGFIDLMLQYLKF